ncbi:MAG: hypothetical protein RO009_23210 [Pseudorhodoplanes sp.]|jgi:hypothetical protein|nr:hypothetical protein [Pseudorhodoplanes sp.]
MIDDLEQWVQDNLEEWLQEEELLKAELAARANAEEIVDETAADELDDDERAENFQPPVSVQRPPVYFDPPPPPEPDYVPQRPTGPRPTGFGRVTGFMPRRGGGGCGG